MPIVFHCIIILNAKSQARFALHDKFFFNFGYNFAFFSGFQDTDQATPSRCTVFGQMRAMAPMLPPVDVTLLASTPISRPSFKIMVLAACTPT
jgi:hypothetical protein